MVCSIGNGRMAVMARLIEAGKLSQRKAGEIGQHKLAVQHIYRELREANEPNLLDEEDMHIFGLKPMVDPLHLVCCNACKKPIKASQYAAHAELCSSLRTTEESALEIDGGLGRRKPPRKERKKPAAYTNQPTPGLEQERYELINIDDSTASKSHENGKISYSFSMDSKRNSSIVGKESMMDNLRANHESRDHSASVVLPSAKRSKLMADECIPALDVPENASGLTRIQNTQDIYACKASYFLLGFYLAMAVNMIGLLVYLVDWLESTKGSSGRRISGSKILNDIHENCGQVHKHFLQTKSVPVPLATKIYYSQRSSRLRLAISHQYHDAWTNELSSGGQASQRNMMLSKTSSQASSLEQGSDLLIKEKGPSAQKPDQTLAQSSEVCLSDPGKPPSSNSLNQLPLENVPRSQAASVGFTKSRYITNAYNFSGNSGELMGTMQQPNGSVPVV
ncbi:hypothetical protein SLEP1_g217 [Rubroshorea leprosula]|uniref:SAGA-associated factor 11 n=1 Tax=Rubroshorea leprosula TaxID=152421 RepID=A0AAV5HK82_9ROSI|nr:hypothetical protein SLEP1_g217 [Rubroshorea leprosula]